MAARGAAAACRQMRWCTSPLRPGRLGTPGMLLKDDPRLHAGLKARFEKDIKGGYGLVGKPAPSPQLALPVWGQHRFNVFLDKFVAPAVAPHEAYAVAPEDAARLEDTVVTAPGRDGNGVPMFLARPADAARRNGLCLVYMHGGGMMVQTADMAVYRGLRHRLALQGWTVAVVEFRNSSGVLGNHPFPAGLHDGMAALEYLHARREEYKVGTLVVAGESGGGNLAAAMALKAKQEAKLAMLDGAFLMCPYIAGKAVYEAQPAHLPSLRECDGYFISQGPMAQGAAMYDPEGIHGENPLAFPYYAQPKDVRGLPPHYVHLNELDPLRDEGAAYADTLARGGVAVERRVAAGTFHAAELLAQGQPECAALFDNLAAAMKRFATALPSRA